MKKPESVSSIALRNTTSKRVQKSNGYWERKKEFDNEGFEKDLAKMDVTVGSGEPPRYWYTTGNVTLNRIISGSFYKGIPQGRVTGLVGPSGAGKSFLASNLMASERTYIIIIKEKSKNLIL